MEMEDLDMLSEAERRQCGASIKRVREARGWSQRRLAEEATVSETTVCNIENGAVPHDETLTKLMDALGVEFTTFGIMAPWMADQISALVTLAQNVPRERLPETVGALMTVLGRAARGADLPDLGMNPNSTQVIITAEADIDQNN